MDKIRDKYLIEHGWKIYRIAWIQFCNNKKSEIKELFGFIQNIKNKTNHFYCIDEIKQQIKSKKTWLSRIEMTKLYENKQKEFIPLILNSNINFSKLGWVNQVGKIIDLSCQNVNYWMKRFLPDFYRDKCFKRKRSVA